MEPERLRELLEEVKQEQVSVEEALTRLRTLPFEDLGFARPDHHRALRTGFPEVIFCPGKTVSQIIAIAERLTAYAPKILASRADPATADAIQAAFPSTRYHEAARMLVIPGTAALPTPETNITDTTTNETSRQDAKMQSQNNAITTDTETIENPHLPMTLRPDNLTPNRQRGTVLIVAAGTSDFPVAEEAAVTAAEMGSPVERLYDVGVAGLHRLLAQQDKLHAANVLVVVAGMEGALPSVVGGLVARPVIAVPTSVGYGANFGGLSALLTMLNSCASGIAVVNIDNGFGAGYMAHLINS
jgi:pyridinium-3,5-biscarboxylic acid mononucleotide synthase